MSPTSRYVDMISLDDPPVSALYRSFSQAQHADEFLRGDVRLGTLHHYRVIEDAERRDSDEGKLIYRSGDRAGEGRDESIRHVAQNSRIKGIENVRRVELSNITYTQNVQDCYILCFSETAGDESEKFGTYRIVVHNSIELLRRITERVLGSLSLKSVAIGRIRYSERTYAGLENRPESPIAFTKPVEPYAAEREVRMLWQPNTTEQLAYWTVSVGDLSTICSRL